MVNVNDECTRNRLSARLCVDPRGAHSTVTDFLAGFRGRERREGRERDGKGKVRMGSERKWKEGQQVQHVHEWPQPPI